MTIKSYKSSFDFLSSPTEENHPDRPVIIRRPHLMERAAHYFQTYFKGKVIYAVKANDAPYVLNGLAKAGVRRFDVASEAEIASVAPLKGKTDLFFMNPVKSSEAIRRAYFKYGVRRFAFDRASELEKIIKATKGAKDLVLFLRLECVNQKARLPMVGKFGAPLDMAPQLIKQIKRNGAKCGITFHVGSQNEAPKFFFTYLKTLGEQLKKQKVTIDYLDVGGGFPLYYQSGDPESLLPYFKAIDDGAEIFMPVLSQPLEEALFCEPGRALVGEGESLLVKVISRRGDALFINDGAFGCLYDGAYAKWVYPVRSISLIAEKQKDCRLMDFHFWGPTCDQVDFLPGPFQLPGDIKEGDYIEIGLTGAYGRVMATKFNGMGHYREIICRDDPFQSIYSPSQQGLFPSQSDDDDLRVV